MLYFKMSMSKDTKKCISVSTLIIIKDSITLQ